MRRATIGTTSTEDRGGTVARAAFLALAMAVLFAGMRGDAAPLNQDPLNYSRAFLITGNYVVGGIDLPSGGQTGTISISGVPAGADVVGAFLYWESVYDSTLFTADQLATSVRFRGAAIDSTRIKTNTTSLAGNTAQCWGAPASGGNAKLTMFRADVLNLLPKLYDVNNQWTGKFIVNSADLPVNVDQQSIPFQPHTVTLPNQSGNTAIQSAGAALVVVYRNQGNPLTNTPGDPLTKIVFYDGVYAQPLPSTLAQNLRGFYEHAGNSARMTHIVGSGGNNNTVQVLFNNSVVATNPFPVAVGSGRTWSFPTYSLPQFPAMTMNGTGFTDGFGETATTDVIYGKTNQNACLAWAAVVFSTPVLDADGDGLPDALEDSSLAGKLPWQNPDGQILPDIHAMGATKDHKDLFVEINAMRTTGLTTYGSVNAPYDSSKGIPSVTVPAHAHMPTPEVLTMLGDAYTNAPVQNLDNTTGVRPHFDVGDRSAYLGSECTFNGVAWSPDPVCQYLVPTSAARGGETITETAPVNSRFPDYPGTVGWKFAFGLYRDAPVDDAGNELTTTAQITAWTTGGVAPYLTHRRRFDIERRPFFHYVLYAHARGKPKSLPCILNGELADYGLVNGLPGCVQAANPTFDPLNYHVPSSASGVGDLPGGNVLITLGLWDKVAGIGSAFVNAATTLHELGHNIALWHGGRPAVFGSKALGTATFIEPNCKPNYQSSMSYLFQAHGLVDTNFDLRLNYSAAAQNDLDENSLSDMSLAPASVYQPTWFAPANSALASFLGVNAATKLCNGVKFIELASPPATSMARVWAPSLSPSSDWNVPFDWFGDDSTGTDHSGALNVNFDGVFGGNEVLSDALHGNDDWSNIHLDQIGAVPNITMKSNGDTDITSGDTDITSGDTDITSGDTDITSGDTDITSGDTDITSGDTDITSGDTDITSGAELDFDTAKNMGPTPPHAFKACILGANPVTQQGCTGAWTDNTGAVHATQPLPGQQMYHRVYTTWKAPTVGTVVSTKVFRVVGTTVPAVNTLTPIGAAPATTFVDTEELPNGIQFTYFVRAQFDDATLSGISNFSTITAIDDAPVAFADGYTMFGNTTLTVTAANGVLVNDTDDDSATKFVDLNQITGPAHGTLIMHADGSFIYTPTAGFLGQDSFTYRANDGLWETTTTPLSADSSPATVTINVNPPPKPPVCSNSSGTVITGASLTIDVITNKCTDQNGGLPMTITGVTQGALGTVTFTPAGSVTYSATSPNVGSDSFTVTIGDGLASTTVTVRMKVVYLFVNVQNLPPPPNKSFNPGSTVPLSWRWANAAGVALNSTAAQPETVAFACATNGQIPGGSLVGDFVPANPGLGNSYQLPTATNGWTWQFNWKTVFTVNGTTLNLPSGTYVLRAKSNLTGQSDPQTTYQCDGGTSATGALITLK